MSPPPSILLWNTAAHLGHNKQWLDQSSHQSIQAPESNSSESKQRQQEELLLPDWSIQRFLAQSDATTFFTRGQPGIVLLLDSTNRQGRKSESRCFSLGVAKNLENSTSSSNLDAIENIALEML